MTSRLLALSAAILLAASPAAASNHTRFKDIDALLSRLTSLLAHIENPVNAAVEAMEAARRTATSSHEEIAARARLKLEQKCLTDFSIKTISRHKTPPLIPGTKSPITGMVDALRHYYECQAFTQRKHPICKELSRFQTWEVYGDKTKTPNKQNNFAAYCSGFYKSLILIQANLSRPQDAEKICRTLPFSEEELAGFGLEDECAWMIRKDPGPECRAPISPSIGESEIRECLLHHVLHADETTCPLIEKAPLLTEGARATYRTRCQDALAYRKAYLAKDAERCGSSLVCRMLMGHNVCDRHLDQLKKDYCLSWPQENLKDAVAILAQAEALLVELDEMLEGYQPKSDPGFASRRDAFRSLQKEFKPPANPNASRP